MKFRHHHNNYETGDLGADVIVEMARQMTLDRDTALGNLALLGFPPDHVFEERLSDHKVDEAVKDSTRAPLKRFKHQNEFGGRLEH